MVMPPIRIASVGGKALSVPLRTPFVIASGRLEATRAVLVRVTVEDESGRRAQGLGEAAALPPVTRDDQPELLRVLAAAAMSFSGTIFAGLGDLDAELTRMLPDAPAARAGIETAALDAWARLAGVSLARALGGPEGELPSLWTDITLSISAPAEMAATAVAHRADGFTCFKVKVGRDWQRDRDALREVARAVPDATFRIDANAGFSAADALALLDDVLGAGLKVECFEQPCRADDWAGMAAVTAAAPVPVVADESFRGGEDLERILTTRAATGVNLKLAKLGGPLAAVALGRRARDAGLQLMAGAMVETRVGLLAMAHVVAALGGVSWVDLDTAFLLAADPFQGGWRTNGPALTLEGGGGLATDELPAT